MSDEARSFILPRASSLVFAYHDRRSHCPELDDSETPARRHGNRRCSMSRGIFSRGVVCVWAALSSLTLLVAPARCAERQRADLYLWVDGRGSARILLRLEFTPPPAIPWEAVLSQTLGGAVQEVEQAPDE